METDKPKRHYTPRSKYTDEQRFSIDASDREFTAAQIAFEAAAYRRAYKALIKNKREEELSHDHA